MRHVGFNCTDFMGMGSIGETRLADFATMRRLGFNFLRVPLNYRLWRRAKGQCDATFLARLDAALAAALDQGLHLCLAMHRAPGYTVSKEGPEPGNLWHDPASQTRFIAEWLFLAGRYDHVPADALSINLVNEPPPVHSAFAADTYVDLMRRAALALRQAGFAGEIIADGLDYGRDCIPGLIGSGLTQACRGYEPFITANGGSPWRNDARSWPVITPAGATYGRQWLAGHYAPWIELARRGEQILCGEAGCPAIVPGPQALAWFSDLMEILAPSISGLALWEFRGPQGLFDGQRAEARLSATPEGKLDGQLLDLLLGALRP